MCRSWIRNSGHDIITLLHLHAALLCSSVSLSFSRCAALLVPIYRQEWCQQLQLFFNIGGCQTLTFGKIAHGCTAPAPAAGAVHLLHINGNKPNKSMQDQYVMGKGMQNCLEVLDRKLNGVVHDICYWLIVFLLFLSAFRICCSCVDTVHVVTYEPWKQIKGNCTFPLSLLCKFSSSYSVSVLLSCLDVVD